LKAKVTESLVALTNWIVPPVVVKAELIYNALVGLLVGVKVVGDDDGSIVGSDEGKVVGTSDGITVGS
jgi:hypothetical protein